MNRTLSMLAASSMIIAATGLSACGKKGGDETNIVEMNASDGSMNDMTVVESATLDEAGAAAGNAAEVDNSSNAM